jgi:acetate kinase
MSILVFNSGSSSLKFQLFETTTSGELKTLARGMISALGEQARCKWVIEGEPGDACAAIRNHHDGARWILNWLQDNALLHTLTATGHRVVHGGDIFSAPVCVSESVVTEIEALNSLAPLHNPLAVQVIRACQTFLSPDIPMVAVFDTAFFHALPDHVSRYALPHEWTHDYGIKRYGFHGTAHRSLYQRYHEIGKADAKTSRVITVQLGQGCSVAAIRGGTAVETSMGFTPLEGLIMATRCGDIDPGALLHLAERLSIEQLREGLNQRAGLLGLSGASADMRELLRLEAQGHSGAKLAIDAFCHHARKYLGAYLAVLGGADAIVLSGGIGEHAPLIRERICAGMEWCGLVMDKATNAAVTGASEACISASSSHVAVYVIPADEELLIARDTEECLAHYL